MSDYKFEILSKLVQYDDFEPEIKLFGDKLELYENMLHNMDWYEHLVVRRLINNAREIIITDKGRNYYFDMLLPQRTQHIVTSGTDRRHTQSIMYGIIGALIGALATIIVFKLGGH